MKKLTSYLLTLSCLSVVLVPLSASALSLKSVFSDIKSEKVEEAEVRTDVKANIGTSVSVEAKAEAEARAQAKMDNKDDKKSEKSERKEGKSLKENRGFWVSWFARFFGKTDLDIKSAVITKNNATSTTIGWVTNQETKGTVYFSTDASLSSTSATTGLLFVEDSAFSVDHKTTLSGLSANTKYYYFIEYQNRAGETLRSEIHSFRTKAISDIDITAPRIIFQTTLKVDSDSAQIIWVTNEASNSKVWINSTVGVNTSGTPIKSSDSMSVFHSATVSGLSANTQYFFIVGSTDAQGNLTLSIENSFKTSTQ